MGFILMILVKSVSPLYCIVLLNSLKMSSSAVGEKAWTGVSLASKHQRFCSPTISKPMPSILTFDCHKLDITKTPRSSPPLKFWGLAGEGPREGVGRGGHHFPDSPHISCIIFCKLICYFVMRFHKREWDEVVVTL